MSDPAAHPLHVGLNLHYLHEQAGGAKTYARELMRGLLAVEPGTRLTGFVTDDAPDAFVHGAWEGDVRWERLPRTVGRLGLSPVASVAGQWFLEPRRARVLGVDVIHGPANVVPLLTRTPTVVTMLDLIWLHHPTTLSRFDTLGMKMLGLPSARHADRVIAISEAGKRDLVQTIGLDPGRIDVTMLGIAPAGAAPATAPDELRRRLDLGAGPVILCVAQKRVHKNLDGLIAAFAQLPHPDAVLVIPGAPTPHEAELRALAGRLGVADRVRLPDWVSAEDLEGLFAVAAAFVLPSLMEGFGLPIVEAMQRGVPVACSDVSSLPEVAGDAALLFDPRDHAAMTAAMARLLDDRDLAAELGRRGRRRCDELTWAQTARATLASYRRAIDAHRR